MSRKNEGKNRHRDTSITSPAEWLISTLSTDVDHFEKAMTVLTILRFSAKLIDQMDVSIMTAGMSATVRKA